MTDMATMPIPDLIDGLREKGNQAIDDGLLVHGLLFNLLANRFAEQEEKLHSALATRSENE